MNKTLQRLIMLQDLDLMIKEMSDESMVKLRKKAFLEINP